MTTPVERTRAIQRARERRAAAKFTAAQMGMDGVSIPETSQQVREPMATRKNPPSVTDETPETDGKAPLKEGRKHRATYARDNRKGGYMVRVTGPYPERFAGREIPVTTRAGDEHTETLDKLVWAGKDKESGEPVALYTFVSKPREETELSF